MMEEWKQDVIDMYFVFIFILFFCGNFTLMSYDLFFDIFLGALQK
jgi:hypothetical protein